MCGTLAQEHFLEVHTLRGEAVPHLHLPKRFISVSEGFRGRPDLILY